MAEQPEKKLTFEESLAELERIVSDVEQGKIGLEQSIERYEQGMKLIKRCRTILDTAEKRIETISKDSAPADPAESAE